MTPAKQSVSSDGPAVQLEDLSPELRKQIEKRTGKKLRAPRRSTFTKDNVRTYALRCLSSLAELSPSERGRVLQHALRVNRV